MNEKSKKIQVNASSLADLKAELLRKQQQFRQEKLQGSSHKVFSQRKEKPSPWSKKNAGVQERAQRDQEAKEEESSDLQKSRASLEAKAKLYEKMTQSSTVTGTDGDETFLVDFQKKALDEKLEQRQQDRKREEDEERQQQLDMESKVEPGKEWVDYWDADGKSRRCLSEDLDMLREQSKMIPVKSLIDTLRPDAEMLSEDMKRELQRQKWEHEAQANLEGPVHYSNVQFDEQRSHGVGYFQFAKQEEERKKQMEALNQLREQTLTQRNQRERVKAKRQALMEARLAKVKQRRMVQQGGALLDMQEEKSDEDEQFGPKLDEALNGNIPEPEELKRDDSWRKNAPTREWDKGKPKFSAETWVDKQRKERPNEFAPPQEYYVDTQPVPKLQKTSHWKSHKLYTEETFLSEIEGEKCETIPSESNDGVKQRTLSEADPVDAGLAHIRSQLEQNTAKATTDVNSKSNTKLDIPLPPDPHYETKSQAIDTRLLDTLHSEQQTSHNYQPAWMSDQTKSPRHQYHELQFDGRIHSLQYSEFSQQDSSVYGSLPYKYPESAELRQMETVNSEINARYSHPDHCATNTYSEFKNEQGLLLREHKYIPARNEMCDISRPQTTEATLNDFNASSQPSQSEKMADQSSGPQPAHYSSAPQRVQPKPAPYVPLHLHKVAPSLPAPPSETNIPMYKSMESVHQKRKSFIDEEKVWHRQFNYNNSSAVKCSGGSKHSESTQKPGAKLFLPAGIPFPAPHVQNEAADKDDTIKFDPTKPPPLVTKQREGE